LPDILAAVVVINWPNEEERFDEFVEFVLTTLRARKPEREEAEKGKKRKRGQIYFSYSNSSSWQRRDLAVM
jgi:hypothetical protein